MYYITLRWVKPVARKTKYQLKNRSQQDQYSIMQRLYRPQSLESQEVCQPTHPGI